MACASRQGTREGDGEGARRTFSIDIEKKMENEVYLYVTSNRLASHIVLFHAVWCNATVQYSRGLKEALTPV